MGHIKHTVFAFLGIVTLFASGLAFSSCKDKGPTHWQQDYYSYHIGMYINGSEYHERGFYNDFVVSLFNPNVFGIEAQVCNDTIIRYILTQTTSLVSFFFPGILFFSGNGNRFPPSPQSAKPLEILFL
jgi:hypothetical protein